MDWTASDGRVIQAKFIKLEGEAVVIEKDGKPVKVPFAKLSAESVALARKLAEIDFALIPAGRFQMGDALDGSLNARVHEVTVSAFSLAKYEVTRVIRRGPRATTRRIKRQVSPTLRRWEVSRRTATGCMTWRGTYGRGAGIGVAPIPRVVRPIRAVLHRARSGCTGAAVGPTTRTSAASRSAAAAATRPARTPAWASALPAVQSHRHRR